MSNAAYNSDPSTETRNESTRADRLVALGRQLIRENPDWTMDKVIKEAKIRFAQEQDQ